jgi:glycosyltransferase involved in cell wall biosynthesis
MTIMLGTSERSAKPGHGILATIFQLESSKIPQPVTGSPSLRVALVGNYAPQRCGIATFTSDVVESFSRFEPGVAFDVHALADSGNPVVHQGVYNEIEREAVEAYRCAARQMNEDRVDAVWIQHEFGIFGGDSGEHILELVERVAAPVAVTMHTVLSDPSPKQADITLHLVRKASALMVMSQLGRDLLINRYGADRRRVHVIEHGAPDRPLRLSRCSGAGAAARLMTFGLLGPGKGLESAIAALPAIVAKHPATVYRIVGMAHPNQLRDHGEEYRESLIALAEQLGVSDHIEWDNRFVSTEDLLQQLEACDIYLTPYLNLQQSTSGTLSFAVALGRAVISTPYIHARELLSETGGTLVEPGDAAAIARAVNHLLDSPDELEAVQLKAYRRGRKTTWSHFAANAGAMLKSIATAPVEVAATQLRAVPGLVAFDAMCDDTGIAQHSIGLVPDRRHGYCLDDCARAMMLVNRVAWRTASEELIRGTRFASFVQHAWNPDLRLFRNFMNFDRTWCEDSGSFDSNGRAIWLLGDTAAHSRVPQLRRWAAHLFDEVGAIALDFNSPRSIAFAALGAVGILRHDPDNPTARAIAQTTGETLQSLLCSARRPDWAWFEAVVSYDNPRLPQTLIECGRVCNQPAWIESGLETLRWILELQVGEGGNFRPVGCESFGLAGEVLPFDQQPVEAWAAIDACVSARQIDASREWPEHAARALRWFHGANDRGVSLVDPQLGSCLDGVTRTGANGNSGAESLLAYQLAYYGYDAIGLEQGTAKPDHGGNRSAHLA